LEWINGEIYTFEKCRWRYGRGDERKNQFVVAGRTPSPLLDEIKIPIFSVVSARFCLWW
jgi:hypothetical protein